MSNAGMPEPLESTVSAGRPYGGLPPAERVAARRARFIEAGLNLFGTQGFRGATVRGICQEAGLTDRYFYESFDSLEALLLAVYRQLMDALRLGLQQVLSDSPTAPQEGLTQVARLAYGVWFDVVRDPRAARVVLVEVLGLSATVDAEYEAAMGEFTRLTTAPLVAANQAGTLSAAQLELLGRALTGAAVYAARWWVASGYALSREDAVEACVLMATGSVAALAAPAAPAARKRAR